MKIYENAKEPDNVIVVLEKGESKQLLEAMEIACKTKPRRKVWKRLKDMMYHHLPLY